MTIQTATLDTGASIGISIPHRLSQIALIAIAFSGIAVLAPSAMMALALTAVLSIGLAGWSVARVIRGDRFGLAPRPALLEAAAGASLVAMMIWLSFTMTAGMVSSVVGSASIVVVAFAAIAAFETLASAVMCYFLKRFAATGAIGAEIAVMLNVQQKYAISLDGQDR